MNDSFLGFGPGHWILGIFIWSVIIIVFIIMYFSMKK